MEINPHIVFIVICIVIVYVILFGNNLGINNIALFLFIGFIVFLLVKFATFYVGIDDISASIGPKETDVELSGNIPSVVPEIKIAKQVFNIPSATHIYNDAKAVCKAYGARLATYDEIDTAYKRGASWCAAGWSEGQQSLWPLSRDAFAEMQKRKGHETECGSHPGVNGGYIADPNVKLGVNCYGYKPRITNQEQDMMNNMTLYPKTPEEAAMDKRVNYWKGVLDSVIVAPFNATTWSRI